MQQLEVLKSTRALDINMGYCSKRLSPTTQDMTTIVTEFDKFRYNCLPMGIDGNYQVITLFSPW